MDNTHPFSDLLRRAVAGDEYALDIIIQAYMPLVIKHSYINGNFDEDCRQFLLLRMLLAIRNFSF